MAVSLTSLRKVLKAIPVVWGRLADRDDYGGYSNPTANPDTTDEDLGERYHNLLHNFAIAAAMDARDFSHLFKSASGIRNAETGDYTDPQLIFTDPENGIPEHLEALAYQYDELFEGNFPPIIRKLSRTAWSYGRCIGEIEWHQNGDDAIKYPGLIYASYIHDRDPAEYLINPGTYPPGLYRKNSAYSTADSGDITRMDDARFLWYAWDPEFENPYGTPITRSLVGPTETWVKIWEYWRLAAEKGGTGVWFGKYPEKFAGKNPDAVARREDFFEMLKTAAQSAVAIFHKDMEVESQSLETKHEIYESLHHAFLRMVSLRWLGSETALAEAAYGTYGAKENEARGRSDLQKYDALWFGGLMDKFNTLFCQFNWADVPVIPQLQLIPVELITPITPKDQLIERGGQSPIASDVNHSPEPASPQEFQAVDEEIPKGSPPVAIPAGYQDFPNTTPLSPLVRDTLDYAHQVLREMPIKEYADVQPNEAPFVFTVKRFRNYTSDMLPILQEMKAAIDLTLDEENEKAAWLGYYKLIEPIFAERGIQMTPDIRNDLVISFRQARQNVFGEAVFQKALDDPTVEGLRLVPRPSKYPHPDEIPWNNLVIPKNHPELRRGGRLRIPLNFGCLHEYEFVYDAAEITPFSQWPKDYPGETYKYYVSKKGEEI